MQIHGRRKKILVITAAIQINGVDWRKNILVITSKASTPAWGPAGGKNILVITSIVQHSLLVEANHNGSGLQEQ